MTKYKFRKPPFKHQIRGVMKLLSTGFGGALLCEPRTGKTKIAVDYASILWESKHKVRHVLVICPIAALKVWEREIQESCSDEGARIRIWDREGRKELHLPTSKKHMNWILINDDAFSTSDKRSHRAGRRYLRDVLVKQWGVDLCIVDESHRIKSPSAKRSRMIHTFSKVRFRVILTGTPVTKKKRVIDIYSQWKFLNPKRFADVVEWDKNGKAHANFSAFKDRYSVWISSPGFPMWVRNKNTKDLRKRIHKDSFEVALLDCRDVPPRLPPQVIPVTLTSSRKPYDDMVDTMMAKLESGEWTTADIKLVQIMRLAQFTSGLARTTEGEWRHIGDEKLQVARSLLSDWFEAEQKVVVCARWREDIARIVEVGKALGVPTVKYQGGTNRTEKDEAVETFTSTEGPALFVGQPKAMGLSIDLAVSHITLWYSLTNSYVDFTQANDRTMLAPVPKSLVILQAEETVDVALYETLLEDKSVVDYVRSAPSRLRSS